MIEKGHGWLYGWDQRLLPKSVIFATPAALCSGQPLESFSFGVYKAEYSIEESDLGNSFIHRSQGQFLLRTDREHKSQEM